MKNIKYFKYVNTHNFETFLRVYGYTINDAIGFSANYKWCYHGNILKEYIIYLSDHDHIFFKVVWFKSFNEYRQSFLGFNGETLLEWYQNANIIWYKLANEYIRV